MGQHCQGEKVQLAQAVRILLFLFLSTVCMVATGSTGFGQYGSV